jgi:hypothetical protein
MTTMTTMTTTPTTPTTPMTYCTYKNFNPSHLTALKPEQSKNAKVACYFINLLYNLGSKEAPDFDDFEMELCEFTSSVGITAKESEMDDGKTRIDESILVKFDMFDEEHQECMEALESLHTRLAEMIGDVKGLIKKFDYKATDPVTSGFKKLIYFQRDEVTGDVIPGRAPSMFLKLFSWGTGDTATSTMFVDMDNKPIDKKLLSGVELKFIPLLQIRRVRSAASITVNMEIKSAIVTSVKARNTESSQFSTLQALKDARPDLKNQVSSQLAKLTANRQNKLLPPSIDMNQQEPHDDLNGTLSGLVLDEKPAEKVEKTAEVTLNNTLKKAPTRNFKIPPVDK